jgi:hypothetical protein
MEIIGKLFKGKKTYIVAIAIVVLGVLEGFDVFEVPYTWWLVLTGAGLGFMRKPVNTIEKSIEEIRKKIK